ncbi:unnamed protein product [Lupinus luteus]|uniref:Uncharacterized protein n=1 Tax=Lupinus luteus TaxID=3873 RepID=A0AAV1WK82_LUPLU
MTRSEHKPNTRQVAPVGSLAEALSGATFSGQVEEQALIRREDSTQGGDNDFSGNYQNKKVIPSMTISLALAATLGIAETVALLLGYGTLMHIMEEQALIRKEDSTQGGDNDFSGNYQNKKVIPSMTTSLALAATLGIAETVALLLGYGTLMHIMGQKSCSFTSSAPKQVKNVGSWHIGTPSVIESCPSEMGKKSFAKHHTEVPHAPK